MARRRCRHCQVNAHRRRTQIDITRRCRRRQSVDWADTVPVAGAGALIAGDRFQRSGGCRRSQSRARHRKPRTGAPASGLFALVDRLLALETPDIDVEQIKWVVLMVLFSQPGQELAYARMEDLVFEESAGALH